MRPAKPRTLRPSYMLGTGFVLISLRRNRCGQHDDQATWKTNSGCKQEPVFIETWSSHQWHVQQLLYELCYLYHCLHGSGINSSSWKWGATVWNLWILNLPNMIFQVGGIWNGAIWLSIDFDTPDFQLVRYHRSQKGPTNFAELMWCPLA